MNSRTAPVVSYRATAQRAFGHGSDVAVKVVAWSEGDVIGNASGLVGEEGSYVWREVEALADKRLSRDVEVVGYVETVEVVPAFRGRGIGLRLVGRIVAEMRKNGADEIWLAAVAYEDDTIENRNRLARLYAKVGFRKVRDGSSAMVWRK